VGGLCLGLQGNLRSPPKEAPRRESSAHLAGGPLSQPRHPEGFSCLVWEMGQTSLEVQ
jgi:hypothetical protein